MPMQQFVGQRLYHLVGAGRPDADPENFETLCAILRSMELRTCEVAGERGGIRTLRDPSRPVTNGEPIQQSVVCLCDIPRRDLPFHARRYGQFGIGVNRSVVAQWGGRPVIYVPFSRKSHGSWGARFPAEVNSVLDGLDRFFPDTPWEQSRIAGSPARDVQEAADLASSLITRDVQAFLKFWDVDLPEDHPENFYMEREWRKFGNLALASCLQEIIAPRMYHDTLRELLDDLRRGERYLICEVELTSISNQMT
jgi:hypothetical protein